MIFHETTLKDAWLIEPEPRGDDRGFFARMMCREEFDRHGIKSDFVQHNMSVSAQKGTVRGMHFQRGKDVEAKLVRCTRGRILDVIVDLRADSPSYMQHEGFELTADNHHMLFVPEGFAHGFQTLTEDCEVFYAVSAAYAPVAEGGLRHDDPALGIDWPLPVVSLSPKDAAWPLLQPDTPAVFGATPERAGVA
ncbi:dTDP-4-dehydrorhamnose 3,5-epimerase [Paenirhodobacter populi]|uniref:dTDP-4-dehydrorhamnose 3,5-epimerase n=1 Tax=Paenirhodobacter populi TaxID=2306993 RepID=A0A443J1P9_9RHOB|nr:dTDP-4-dehydrorhamnose 3,5-epimerase [Sinirhodobacter populi]RWR14397.1 dTDP-4-dehydrorhamnose 3,5-epimerase [Sinirhodobacter populi]